jgi:hypothetical protein
VLALQRFGFLGVLALALAGCGGGGAGTIQGSVSGVVFDVNGNPVRGATVYTGDQFNVSTVSGSGGSYVLTPVAGQVNTIHASLSTGGSQYVGQNVFQVFAGEQTKSVNITLVPTAGLATASGSVTDRGGRPLANVQVSAQAATWFTASMTLSASDGTYHLTQLVPGVSYTLLASGKNYNSDRTVTTFNNSENRSLNFVLNDPTNSTVATPTSLTATSYTSPANPSRSLSQDNAIENMKRILDPTRAKRKLPGAKTRSTPNGNYTEIDLNWTGINDPALLGYGIYRAQGSNTPTASIDFLGDPQASFYADLDATLLVGNTYTYAISSLNSTYGSSGGSASPLSNNASALILGDLFLSGTDVNAVTFNWQAAPNATVYGVYLFDQYPDLGVSSIWNSDTATEQVTGTAKTYDGAGQLVSGHTYYFIVVGRNPAGNGVTFSPVGSFVKS